MKVIFDLDAGMRSRIILIHISFPVTVQLFM